MSNVLFAFECELPSTVEEHGKLLTDLGLGYFVLSEVCRELSEEIVKV